MNDIIFRSDGFRSGGFAIRPHWVYVFIMLRQWSSLKYSDCKSESSTRRIANPTERVLTHNSLHPPLPPPFQEWAQFACHAIQVPPRSKGRLGGDGQPPRISRIFCSGGLAIRQDNAKTTKSSCTPVKRSDWKIFCEKICTSAQTL